MNGTLVLAILRVQSSYLQEIEQPVQDKSGVPDTVQWWIQGDHGWRIKTFGVDHDLHVEEVNRNNPKSASLIKQAEEYNLSHYGDVMQVQHVISFDDCDDSAEVRLHFEGLGLKPRLEKKDGSIAYWKPDEAAYSTQSRPW